MLAPKLIGRDPTEPVRIWEELYAFSRDFGQKGTYIESISALDIAFWDIAGQAAGLPVWKLLGGRFTSGATLLLTSLAAVAGVGLVPEERRASGVNDVASGVLLLAALGNFMNIMVIPPHVQDVVNGIVILLAVSFYGYLRPEQV